ncbi:MAG: hypothetical protein CVU86_07055 [Firmicutes bacterium HGW-Firmicutes-11]|nr:MAG: hypothetical protein CVU94_00750 [Firmicutes bacterium HGW-Firmicutes-19]PKM84483.1 MAG: hypothetical protein CVU86_07055 [Firmicutes bacterium HGW-Firmicutes-11]
MEKYAIALANSRKSTQWKNTEITWKDFIKKLSVTTRTRETVAEFAKMKKLEQDEIKDVGGFVCGHLKEGKRRNGYVVKRSMLTLDADFARRDFWEELTALNDFRCAIYSTHKHTPKSPRLRLLVPLSRDVSAEEYEAIARKLAEELGIDQFDDTTYQSARLMYWPSTSSDGEYFFDAQEGDLLDADEMLDKYTDWKDISYWPMSSRTTQIHQSAGKKQEDPTAKGGMIGAFCRTYNIHQAIDKYLSDIYLPTDKEDRYTYVNGSTAAGLVVYQDKFAYSNHATDPSSGMLCNAFDLVRLHLFGHLDADAPEGPINKQPSFTKMNELATNDPDVVYTVNKERISSANVDFEGIEIDEEKAVSDEWIKQLKMAPRGGIEPTIENMLLILRNDPNLANLGGFNEFNYRSETFGALPWNKDTTHRSWSDTDDAGLRHYVEKVYQVSAPNKLEDALALRFEENKFHPVRQYLDPLVWDEEDRLDYLLIDYLGAEDSHYVRAVTRKAFTAAVTRIMRPGTKFDFMLTLTGVQGIGKSTLIKKMARNWYSDSLISIGTKDAYEALQGVWLIEMAELTATKKAEVEAVKQFISKQEDTYRKAYARRSTVNPRQCVFFGTTNTPEFLRDMTGNRRFWPVKTEKERIRKSVFDDLDDATVDQLWAEAKFYYSHHESLFLTGALEEEALKRQEEHSEFNPKIGLILQYLETPLPPNWDEMDLYQRRNYLHGEDMIKAGSELIKGTTTRTRVCAAEIWCELFRKEMDTLTNLQAREINDILAKLEGWEKAEKPIRFRIFGAQRGYRKIGTL